MKNEIEKIEIIIKMAKENGRLETLCGQMKEKLLSTRQKLEEVLVKYSELKMLFDNCQSDALSSLSETEDSFIILSKGETKRYISKLDDEHRIYACHFLEHTLSQKSLKRDYDFVRGITQLGDIQRQEELADSMKKAATNPSSIAYHIGNYNKQVDEQNNSFCMKPMDKQDKKKLESKNDETGRN